MIDLHIHTTYSDGTDSLIKVLEKAEKMNLDIISITDHDKVDAYFELKNIDIKKYFSGKIINGSEVKSIYKGRSIEILGYGININRIKNSKYIVSQVGDNKQEECLENMKKIGRSIGLKFNKDIHINKENVFASSTFGNEIFKYNENFEIIKKYDLGTDGNNFYRKGQSNPDSIFYIDESKDVPSPDIIINEIHEAGGLAFLAHPYIYSFENISEVIENFIKDYNIDGLECYYSLFTDNQTYELLNFCKKYNLYSSGGSYYHGMNKPDIELGIGKGNLNIKKDIIEDWIGKIN